MQANKAQPIGLQEGIYFNLDEADYHNDPALSHSGMVKLLESPLDYWEKSPLNPNRRLFERTDAMMFGHYCHMLLLEKKRFFQKYAVSGMRADPRTHTYLSKSTYRDVADSVDMIRKVKYADDHFKNGYPEVSIFWRDPATGIMLRIRVDYLRTFGAVDYKRIKSINRNTIGGAICDHGYDIQWVLYTEGITRIKQLLREGKAKVFGDVDAEWLKAFIEDPDVIFRLFFQRSMKPYVWRLFKTLDDEILELARVDTRRAIEIYKEHIEKHGTDEWPAGSAEAEDFSIYHIPKRIYDRGQ